MKILGIISLVLIIGNCSGSQQSKQQTQEEIQSSVHVDIDSLALVYKESGRKKSADGNKQGAIEDYTKAIEINPKYAIAYFNRAIVNAEIGETQKAIQDYSKAIEIDPLEIDAYYGRAFEKDILGDYNGAILDYNKAIELDSSYISAYLNRGVDKFEIGDFEGGIVDCRLGIKICANTKKRQSLADLHNNHGRFLYDLKRFKESAEAYGDGIKHFPEDYKLYYGRGLARNQSGDKKGACEDWRKSSDLGCFEANALLPLCDECKTDKTKK